MTEFMFSIVLNVPSANLHRDANIAAALLLATVLKMTELFTAAPIVQYLKVKPSFLTGFERKSLHGKFIPMYFQK